MKGAATWFARKIAECRVAFMTLTRLPMGRLGADCPSIGASVWAFPLVGLGVGVLAGLVFWAGYALHLPMIFTAFLVLAVQVVITGALHEDALADVADGFGGGRDRAHKLEIMRDSRVGAYGVIALVLSLGARAAAISMLPAPGQAGAALVLAGTVSRLSMTIVLGLLPAARDEGMGHRARGVSRSGIIGACLVAASVITVTDLAPIGVIVALLSTTMLMSILALKQIGGQTGDVLGATQQVSEIAIWAAILTSL